MKKNMFPQNRPAGMIFLILFAVILIFVLRLLPRAKPSCGKKDDIAVWCDAFSYDQNVPREGMVVYVADGGCEVAAMNCTSPDQCPQDAWTCMAQCPADPHMMITGSGCECEGNWRFRDGRCVCDIPFFVKNGKCVSLVNKECKYDRDVFASFVSCYAPLNHVEIYWQGQQVHECRGACFTAFCITKESKKAGDYLYFRGGFRDKIPVDQRTTASAYSGIGGFYEVCRARM